MKRVLSAASILLLVSGGAAMAGHGKAGLWNVSTTMNMTTALPPATLAKMKAAGMKMPSTRAITSQMCMTQAEVDANAPPGDRQMHCDSHLTSQTASSMTADVVCKGGRMTGTGHTQIAYRGAEHYAGSYSFDGVMEGRPVKSSSNFRGDWVKADCGAVKPYMPRP